MCMCKIIDKVVLPRFRPCAHLHAHPARLTLPPDHELNLSPNDCFIKHLKCSSFVQSHNLEKMYLKQFPTDIARLETNCSHVQDIAHKTNHMQL